MIHSHTVTNKIAFWGYQRSELVKKKEKKRKIKLVKSLYGTFTPFFFYTFLNKHKYYKKNGGDRSLSYSQNAGTHLHVKGVHKCIVSLIVVPGFLFQDLET